MPTTTRLRWGIVLSHSLPGDIHRCLRVSLAGKAIYLCARCVGLYPALIVGFVMRLVHGAPHALPLPGWAELTIRLIVPLIGAAAWGLEQFGVRLSKLVRVVSGAFLGLGLGWVLGHHLRAPWPRELLELAAALGLVLVLGLVGRLTKVTAEAPELGPERPRGGKKTDDRSENEVDPRAS